MLYVQYSVSIVWPSKHINKQLAGLSKVTEK